MLRPSRTWYLKDLVGALLAARLLARLRWTPELPVPPNPAGLRPRHSLTGPDLHLSKMDCPKWVRRPRLSCPCPNFHFHLRTIRLQDHQTRTPPVLPARPGSRGLPAPKVRVKHLRLQG